ncbi:hypothetical protein LUZ60_010187 [Juncus effusus]|nr:hypothetical protein LUZ60_010187 [Juncus effusus]
MEKETREISTDKESDFSNGHAINPSQSDSSQRPGQDQQESQENREITKEEKPKTKSEEEAKRELEEQETMASDTNEEKLIITKKKFISQSKSMERSSTGPSNERRASVRTGQSDFLSPVRAGNGERERVLVLEKSSSRKSQCGAIRKPLHPDNILHADDDDTCSVTSSTTPSVRAARAKITIPIAPTFISGDRAQKRREYYSKLEEKHRAMEEEKKQAEARKLEEQEAAIKELRKTLKIRANPVPSFYHEPPPPKVALKKVPPTRAKSPKLTRRKSCSDAKEGEGIVCCTRMHRHSLETCNKSPLKNSPNTPLKNSPNTPKTPIVAKIRGTPPRSISKSAEQTGTSTGTSGDISVQN